MSEKRSIHRSELDDEDDIEVLKDKDYAPPKKRQKKTHHKINIQKIDLLQDCVSIMNFGEDAVHLKGWKITNAKGDQTYTFGDHYIMPGTSLTLWAGRYHKNKHHPPTSLFWDEKDKWNMKEDTCKLYDPDDNLVDEMKEIGTHHDVIIQTLNLEKDFFTILNQSSKEQDLSGWFVKNSTGNQQFTFDEGFKLKPGESVSVWSGRNTHIYGYPPGSIFWTTRFIWNNKGDSCSLYDCNGILVNTVTHTHEIPKIEEVTGKSIPAHENVMDIIREIERAGRSEDESKGRSDKDADKDKREKETDKDKNREKDNDRNKNRDKDNDRNKNRDTDRDRENVRDTDVEHKDHISDRTRSQTNDREDREIRESYRDRLDREHQLLERQREEHKGTSHSSGNTHSKEQNINQQHERNKFDERSIGHIDKDEKRENRSGTSHSSGNSHGKDQSGTSHSSGNSHGKDHSGTSHSSGNSHGKDQSGTSHSNTQRSKTGGHNP